MGFFSSLFEAEREPSIYDVRKSILAFTSLSLRELLFTNPQAFISSFSQNPSNALKARLYSTSILRLGKEISKVFPDIDADFYDVNDNLSVLLFDFKAYSGVVSIDENTQVIVPCYVAIIYSNDNSQQPALFMLEQDIDGKEPILIQIQGEGLRINFGGINVEYGELNSFLNSVVSSIENQGSPKEKSSTNRSDIVIIEKVLIEEYGISLDDIPEREPVEELYVKLSEGLSHNAKVSLMYKLVVFSYLAAAKILRDSGSDTSPDRLVWLTELINRSVDYSEASEDRLQLEDLTNYLNANINSFLSDFGINRGN